MADKPQAVQQPSQSDLIIQGLADKILNSSSSGGKKYLGFPGEGPLVDAIDETVKPGEKAPRYGPAAEWIPVMAGKKPPEIAVLQDQLVRLGVLDTDFTRGAWDPPSRQAFIEILSQANASGVEYPEAMKNLENSQPMEIGPDGLARRRAPGSKTRAPKVLQLTNPTDLVATANEVAQKRLGRTLSQDELHRFVSSYQATESGAQSAVYDMGGTGGTGGTYTAPPSAENAANTFAEGVDPVAAQARNMLPMVEGINRLLNGSNDVNTVQPMQGSMK